MNPWIPVGVAMVFAGVVLWLIVDRLRVDRRRRHLSEYITNNMPSGVVTVDRKGSITGHNPASQQIFGYEMGTGRRLADLVDEAPRFRGLLEECLDTGQTFTRVEFNVPERSGPGKRIGATLSPITNERGQIKGAICLFSDLTEIVRLQEQVRLKDNFAALGEMSAGIAHEFKNSLATISGYSQILRKESDLETMRSYAGEIDKETRSLAKIVTDFLNFARPVRPSMEEADLADLVREAVEDLRNVRGSGFTVEIDPGAGSPVRCDATLLKQALLNLLINAAEALPEGGGSLRVSLGPVSDRSEVILTVTDTGSGIPEDRIGKVFIPFFTTKAAGTGLGLPLVQKIVLAHNGRIDLESREGHGTRVILTLPSADKRPLA